jgi:hypothetical protein
MGKDRKEDRIIANWFVDPQGLLSVLGINKELDPSADFQILAEFRFGTLGYDHEEGLKFETCPENIADLVSWIHKMHKEHSIPYVDKSDGESIYYVFSVCFTSNIYTNNEKYVAAFQEVGLVNSESIEWVLEGPEDEQEA